MTELYSRRSFLAGVLTAGMLSTSAGYFLTRREPVTLVLATGDDPTGGRQLLVDLWNRFNPDIFLDVKTVASSTQDQFDKFIEGDPDIYNLDVIHIPKFADAGRIVPVVPRNEISLLPAVRRLSRHGDSGEFWAVPFNADVGMLYRRVRDKNVQDSEPTLGEVLRDQPEQFVGQLKTVSVQTDEAFVCNVLEHALAQDEAILDADGRLSYSIGQWRAALNPLATAVRLNRVKAEAGEDDTNRAFQRLNLRYMRNWPVDFPAVDRAERLEPQTAEIRLGRLPIGVLGGQSLAIAASCKHREQAERAIQFLTDTPAQLLLAGYGFAPTGVDAYIDPRLRASLPHLSVIRYAVEGGRPRPRHKNYPEFATRFADHTKRFLYDNEPLTQRFIEDIREVLG